MRRVDLTPRRDPRAPGLGGPVKPAPRTPPLPLGSDPARLCPVPTHSGITPKAPTAGSREGLWAGLEARLLRPDGVLDAELASWRGQVLQLSKQDLHRLRTDLHRLVPKAQRRALKGTGVLTGAATVDKVMQLIGGPGRTGRLPEALKSSIRTARAQNMHALMERAALKLVNGNAGLFRGLNPGDEAHPEGFDIIGSDGLMDSVAQRYALLDTVARLFRVGLQEEDIRQLCQDALHGAATGSVTARTAQDGLLAVLRAGQQTYARRAGACEGPEAPPDMGPELRMKVAERLSQVRWLEAKVLAHLGPGPVAPLGDYSQDLGRLLGHVSAAEVGEALDARFETALDFAVQEGLRIDSVPKLDTVKFERFGADRPARVPEVSAQRLPSGHVVRAQLSGLRARLEAGERSAVGVAYCTQTFPREVLDRVARGELKVVGFDGAHDAGLEFIRNRYGLTEDGLRLGARVMGLQGVYGSFPRSLVTLDDGQQFLLVSGYGSSRQLNNVATLMLYTDDQGRRLPASQVSLATDHTDLVGTLRTQIQDAVRADWGARPGAPDAIPTRLMILQNPTHLEHLLKDSLRWGAEPEQALLPFMVAYRTHEDGAEERIIIPKVGGGGLYGDTAGHFIEAFYGTGFANLVDDVIFNGAAGGFAGTIGKRGFDEVGRVGLPEVKPGGLIMPTRAVEQYGDGRGPQPMPSRLGPDPQAWPAPIRAAVKAAQVHLTGQHVAVMAPAMETFGMIHDLVGQGHASIDVEAGAVMQTCRALGKSATVIYTHSDDPRASEDHPNTALGMVAPFLEGSHYHHDLFEFIRVLWDHSHAG